MPTRPMEQRSLRPRPGRPCCSSASAIVVGIAIARTHHRLRAVGVAYAVLLALFAVSGFLLPIVQSAAGFAVAVAAALLAVQLPRTAELAAPVASRVTE